MPRTDLVDSLGADRALRILVAAGLDDGPRELVKLRRRGRLQPGIGHNIGRKQQSASNHTFPTNMGTE